MATGQDIAKIHSVLGIKALKVVADHCNVQSVHSMNRVKEEEDNQYLLEQLAKWQTASFKVLELVELASKRFGHLPHFFSQCNNNIPIHPEGWKEFVCFGDLMSTRGYNVRLWKDKQYIYCHKEDSCKFSEEEQTFWDAGFRFVFIKKTIFL